jgi:hypothetical protein
MKMTVFWDVTPCSLAEIIGRRLTSAYCLHHQGDEAVMMEAVSTSKTSVSIYQTTQRNFLTGSHIQNNL